MYIVLVKSKELYKMHQYRKFCLCDPTLLNPAVKFLANRIGLGREMPAE